MSGGPYVGQDVLFHPYATDTFPGHDAPRAAKVAAVTAAGEVNLAVFDADGGVLARKNVLYVRPGVAEPGAGYCVPAPAAAPHEESP